MNKILSSLLVLSVVFNTVAPTLNAAEILTDSQSTDSQSTDQQSEMNSSVEKMKLSK